MRLAQQVDLDWGNSPEHLADIMRNPAPAKIFGHLDSVLCVGPDMVPQDMKKAVCVKSLRHFSFSVSPLAVWRRLEG